MRGEHAREQLLEGRPGGALGEVPPLPLVALVVDVDPIAVDEVDARVHGEVRAHPFQRVRLEQVVTVDERQVSPGGLANRAVGGAGNAEVGLVPEDPDPRAPIVP